MAVSPEYWKGLAGLSDGPVCNHTTQLKEIANYHLNPHGSSSKSIGPRKRNKHFFKSLMKRPCLITNVLSVSLQNTIPEDFFLENIKNNIFDFMVRFQTDRYVEIITTREYSGISLFAEIGGYVGIFIGLSISQLLIYCFAFYQWLLNIQSL